jgi:hypothetical protein
VFTWLFNAAELVISFQNISSSILTPRGLLTFDPDQFGQAKFRQSEAIDEFLIFEILDLAIHICD